MKNFFRLAVATAALSITTLAHAQTSLFANFQQIGSAKPFQFINAGINSSFVTSVTVPVNFFYRAPNSSGTIDIALPANLTITSIVNGTASVSAPTISQKLQSVEMVFTGTGAVTGNLLTILNSSTGTLGGILGDSGAGLEETHGVSGGVANYSSAYLDFSASTQRNYSLALNNIAAPGLANGPGNYLAGFTSDATGQFSSNGIVPEPSTVLLLGLGGLGLIMRYRRKENH
ncbi:PEP-CTERM sorting domain-containing protein [Armatimonas sp.]|uniref:PEP-CTERM sorting domain-containing protein n=1 Tax=Armatimonas sp. TaxID=1872638 RepID=UPI00286CF08D|nr:PEP-CTERM sorting domain-containing protein [Armatimonas sp.]